MLWTVVLEKTLESPLDCKEIQPVNPKGNQPWIFTVGDWCWSWSSNPLATQCKELTHWKRPWYWERLTAEVERGDRGWDGWMASPTQWAWVWASSRSWWWTGKPGVLQSMGSQRVGHDWETELNEAEVDVFLELSCFFDDPVDVGNLISGSSVFLNPACTLGSSWFTYCRSLVWSILSMTLLACEMSVIVREPEHSLALSFFGIGMKTHLFQSCGPCWVFQICWHIECSTFTASSLRTWNSSTGILSPPLALFIVMLPNSIHPFVPGGLRLDVRCTVVGLPKVNFFASFGSLLVTATAPKQGASHWLWSPAVLKDKLLIGECLPCPGPAPASHAHTVWILPGSQAGLGPVQSWV